MATLPIHLEVEAESVGPVLIALRKMPGIIKMHLDVMAGTPAPEPREKGRNKTEEVLALMVKHKGGIRMADLMKIIGGPKTSLYTAVATLKKQHVVTSHSQGEYVLTAKAKRELLGEVSDKVRKSNGRAPQGAGRQQLLQALTTSPGPRGTVTKVLVANGVSEKTVSGLFDRAKRDNLIKKVGDNWELTAAGKKTIETPEVQETA
jgi:Mn-dependent DtxR family transcriptional regulator